MRRANSISSSNSVKRVREKLKDSTDPRDRPLLDMTWDYPVDEEGEVDPESVLAEINGYYVGGEKDGQPLDNFNQMTDDGSTAGGCWIYAGIYAGGQNMAARRKPRTEQDETAAEWAWAWPANRRILYNRASAAPDGTPVVGAEEIRLVGRGIRQVDGQGCARLPDRSRTLGPIGSGPRRTCES